MSIVTLIICLGLILIVWYGGVLLGYMAGERATRQRCQQLLDAWAAETGNRRIVLPWGDERHGCQ